MIFSRAERSRWRVAPVAALAAALALVQVQGFTVKDLLAERNLTPKRFANHFDDFDFQLFPYVQDPEVFLSTKRGNCQDYAILADYILARKDYVTRLIRVVLVGGGAHDVCYVKQAKAYLDYNLRIYTRNLQRSGPTLREIADRVADSFDQDWTSVSLYTYTYREDVKHLKYTVVKTDPPSEDPDVAGPSS